MQYVKSFKPEALDDPRLNRIMQNLDRELQKIAWALAVPSLVWLIANETVLDLTANNVALTWADLDLSGTIPPGSVAAYIHITIKDTAIDRYISIRKNGHNTTYVQSLWTQVTDHWIDTDIIIGVDANSIIEWQASHADLGRIVMQTLGYFNE